jgi:hypothetical protein
LILILLTLSQLDRLYNVESQGHNNLQTDKNVEGNGHGLDCSISLTSAWEEISKNAMTLY